MLQNGAQAPHQTTTEPRRLCVEGDERSGEREGATAPQQVRVADSWADADAAAPYDWLPQPPQSAAEFVATAAELEPPDYLYAGGALGASLDVAAADLMAWVDDGADHWAGAGPPPPEWPPSPPPSLAAADFALARTCDSGATWDEEKDNGGSSGSDSDSDWPDPAEHPSAPWPGRAPCPSTLPLWAVGAFELCD
jgi:hypothetical protein